MYLPIMLDVSSQKVLVVGGGRVAARKCQTLLEYGAKVHVVSPVLCPEMRALVDTITYDAQSYAPKMLEGCRLVIAATDNAETNRRVFEDCQQRGLLVNAVDDKAHCSFLAPAVVRRGDFLLAVSTCGQAPFLAASVRKELEAHFPDDWGETVRLLGEIRSLVLQSSLEPEKRKQFLSSLLGCAKEDLQQLKKQLQMGGQP